MTPSTRRQFLRAAGVTVAGVFGLSAIASAEEPPERPDHITSVSDDPAELETYQPALHASYSTRNEMQDIYGWKAESSEYDTDAYYYWIRYPSQESVFEEYLGSSWFGAADAHLRDHEPFVAFVDPDTGELDSAIYSSGHHYADELSADDANLTTDKHPDHATHVNLSVDMTHHHYNDEQDGDGALPSEFLGNMESWLDKRDPWYENGVYEKSDEDAVESGWDAREHGMWWAENTRDAQFKSIYQTLNLGGAGDVRGDL